MAVIQIGRVGRSSGIAGVLIPTSPKFQLTKGGTVWLRVVIENVGGLAIEPYYWFRVHHSATFGTGSLIQEWRGRMASFAPGSKIALDKFLTDSNPTGWRDVFIKLAPTTFDGGLNPTSYSGGEDKWASAYEVVGTAGLSILNLTLS